MDLPNPLNSPPQFGIREQIWEPNTGLDPARRIPYSKFRFALPKIQAGKSIFVWPIGIEGFRRSGAATLGIHKYLGRNFVDVHVIHRDEAHIEMTGTFPGLTSRKNHADLINVLTAVGPKQLFLPGVFTRIQNVFCENYDFSHAADDQTHSIDYILSFVRTTTGDKVDAGVISAFATGQPQTSSIDNQSGRTVVVTDGARTSRAISNLVYGTPDKWQVLLDLNKDLISLYNPGLANMSAFELSVARLAVGTVLRF